MTTLLHKLNRLMAARTGRMLFRLTDLYPWQARPHQGSCFNPDTLPEGAQAWLRPDNSRLIELRQRYLAADPRVTAPLVWGEDKVNEDDLAYFRGDNAYVWQVRVRHGNALSYALAYYCFKSGDAEGLLELLDEDDRFGIHLFETDGRPVSRDLLDSAREIQFLIRHAGIAAGPCNILDIGAGYGRLAHRLDQAGGPEVRVFATDAYAPSTFIAEYYLRYRQARRVTVVPLDEVDDLLAATRIHVAVNIHSFSEMTPEAVSWWIEKMAAHGVDKLMIVPNRGWSGSGPDSVEDCQGLGPILARFGYRQLICEPRWADPIVQNHYVDPVHLYLFQRG